MHRHDDALRWGEFLQHHCKGEIDRLAEMVGKRGNTLRNELNPNLRDYKLGLLDDLKAIAEDASTGPRSAWGKIDRRIGKLRQQLFGE